MSVIAILGLRYGVSLGKALYALYTGEPKGVAEFGLKWVEEQLADKAKAREKAEEVDRISNRILKEIGAIPEIERHEADLEVAAAQAAETLEKSFNLDTLFDYLEEPERLPGVWRRQSPIKADDPENSVGALHDLILRSTANALMGCFEELPGFQAWFLRRVRREFQEQGKLGDAWSRWLTEKQIEEVAFEAHYCSKLLVALDKVELFIDHDLLDRADRKQKLDIAYVTLQLASVQGSGEAALPKRGDDLLEDSDSRQSRVLILGKAGSGKTTLLRWYGLQAAKTAESRRFNDIDRSVGWANMKARETESIWQTRVPFFIRLRDYPIGDFPKPSEMTANVGITREVPAGWAQRILTAGRGMLLIDGLDELTPERRDAALVWIRSLIDDGYGKNLFIVSSRPEAVTPGTLGDRSFVEFEVKDLSFDGQIQFVQQWHKAVEYELRSVPKLQAELPAKQNRLIAELRENHSVSALARNPLLCALLCALNRVSDSGLPSNLRELCERSVRMLIRDRDELQPGLAEAAPLAYKACDLDLRMHVARSVAYAAVERPDSALTRGTAVSVIKQSLHPCPQERAEAVFLGLVHRSNLIRETGREYVEFVHNDLRDYLASERYADDNLAADLVRNVRDQGRARWQPILLFATGNSDRRKFRGEVVSRLLRGKMLIGPPSDEDLVLAMRVQDQVSVPLPGELPSKLNRLRERFLPLSGVDQVRGLAAAGESALPYLKYTTGRKPEVDAECIRAIAAVGSITSDERAASLESFLTATADGIVLDALAEALGYEALSRKVNLLQLPSVLEIVLHGRDIESIADHPAIQYVSDLSPLAGLAGLQRLDLTGTQVSDLSPLAELAGLHFLKLDRTQVWDLSPLEGLDRLQRLVLTGTQVSDLSPLEGLDGLQHLVLTGTQVSDLSPLAGLAGLQRLVLTGTQVSDLSPVAGLAGLQFLYLTGTQVLDLSPLAGLAGLQILYLNGTQVSDLSPLAGLAGLQFLYLTGTQVSDIQLKQVRAKLPKCRILA